MDTKIRLSVIITGRKTDFSLLAFAMNMNYSIYIEIPFSQRSIATAQWESLDARKEITEFVDTINAIGSGFNNTVRSIIFRKWIIPMIIFRSLQKRAEIC